MSGFQNSNELSHTEPERTTHPVKEFLSRCGADVSDFPYIRFLVETSEKEIRSGRLYIPLRIPTELGVIFDSIIRITRVLEVPASSGIGHRKFLELEWEIDEHPVPEDAIHDAIQFLGHEVMCPKCRELFNPDPEVIDRHSIRVECSQCLFEWIIRTTAIEAMEGRVPLLLDLLRADPASMRRYLRQWDQAPIEPTNALYFSYFPFHFELWSEQSSLDILFGEEQGYAALSNGIGNDFELLAKGLLNQISLEYFRRSEFAKPTQMLDKTEIQRKSETKAAVVEPVENTPIVKVTPIIDTVTETPLIESLLPAPEKIETSNEMRTIKWTPTKVVPSEVTLVKRKSNFSFGKLALLASGAASIFFIYSVVSKNLQSIVTLPTESDKHETQQAAATPISEVPASVTEEKVTEENLSGDDAKLVDRALSSIKSKPEEKKEPIKPIKRARIIREEPAPKIIQTATKANPISEKIRSERIETFYRQGMLHLKLQQSKEAESEFQQVIDLDPKHAPAYRGLGLAYVYDQRFTEAVSAFETYLKVTKDNFDKESIEELVQTLKDRAAHSDAESDSIAKQ